MATSCWLGSSRARGSGGSRSSAPRNVLHAFRLHAPDEVDDEVAAWLAEAYRVGAQEHVR